MVKTHAKIINCPCVHVNIIITKHHNNHYIKLGNSSYLLWQHLACKILLVQLVDLPTDLLIVRIQYHCGAFYCLILGLVSNIKAIYSALVTVNPFNLWYKPRIWYCNRLIILSGPLKIYINCYQIHCTLESTNNLLDRLSCKAFSHDAYQSTSMCIVYTWCRCHR